MSTAAGAALSNAGLTVLSEEEDLFRASVREFAEGEVRPKVEAMEHARSCLARPGWYVSRV